MAYVKINDDHLKSYADSIRYAKDGTEYTTTLERARAEIALDNGYFDDIEDAVQEKTGTTEPIAKNELASAVMSIPTLVPPVEEKDVNFYDYDGTFLYSYTAAEALQLNTFPDLPTHEGLTCQRWNWEFENFKSYVNSFRYINIGATYIVTSGNTELYFEIPNNLLTNPTLYFRFLGTGSLTIDWGDNTDVDVLSNQSGNANLSINHTYTSALQFPLRYCVKLNYTGSGSYRLGQDTVSLFGVTTISTSKETAYSLILREIRFGESIVGIGLNSFLGCSNLEKVVINNNITGIASNAFYSCTKLQCLILPNSILTLGDSSFANCTLLSQICLPSHINTVGTSLFKNSGLNRLVYLISPTAISNYICDGNFMLKSVVLAGATAVGAGCFNGNSSLTQIKIPNTILSIQHSAFKDCRCLCIIDLSGYDNLNNIPTLLNVNALSGTPSDQIIYVKNQEMLTAFSNATNWSTYADRFQIKGGAS